MPTPWLNLARRAALPACLFAIVLGVRWAIVATYGNDMPVWDQWDAEGSHLLAPWFAGHLPLSELFQPHNEHRVVLTKLLNLSVTLLNGEWDQRLECTVNAFLASSVAMAFFLFGRGAVDRKWHPLLFIAIATLFALPFAWENVVAGFHSQQMFLLGSALGAIILLVSSAVGTARWWVGIGFVVLGLGSMASGFFAAAIVVGLLLLRLVHRHGKLRSALPTLAIGIVLVAVGLITKVTVSYHEPLKAHTLPDFFVTIVRALQWPIDGVPWMWLAIILWLPWLITTIRVVANIGNAAQDSGYILTGLGGWIGLQILATAYARGAGGPGPASRYIETLVFGAAVNVLCLAWLATHSQAKGGRRVDLSLLAIAWTSIFCVGASLALHHIFVDELPPQLKDNYYEQQNTRNYLATGDEAYLEHPEIPYPDRGALMQRLTLPGLRNLQPASIRPPIALQAASTFGFVTRDTRTAEKAGPALPQKASGISPETPPLAHRVSHGSYGDKGAGNTGEWVSGQARSFVGGWLIFEVAGQLGEPGTSLQLRDLANSYTFAEIRPSSVPGNAWHSVFVRTPPEDFIVVAQDTDTARWFAFSDPVEMGTFSYWAWRLTKKGLWIAGIASAGALTLGAAYLQRKRT